MDLKRIIAMNKREEIMIRTIDSDGYLAHLALLALSVKTSLKQTYILLTPNI